MLSRYNHITIYQVCVQHSSYAYKMQVYSNRPRKFSS